MNLIDLIADHIGETYNTLAQGRPGQQAKAFAKETQANYDPMSVAMGFAPIGMTKPTFPSKALQKAQKLGFDTDTILYHGTSTPEEILSFNPNALRAGEGRRTGGPGSVSLATDADIANRYTNTPVDERVYNSYYTPHGPRVLPVVVRGPLYDYLNPDHRALALNFLDNKYNFKTPTDRKFYEDVLARGDWGTIEYDLEPKFFKQNNFTGAKVTEGDNSNVVMYDPTAIRSIFAKFNKKDFKSKDLLASGLLPLLLHTTNSSEESDQWAHH
jgi:hypothetical protein